MTAFELLQETVVEEWSGNPWVDTGCWATPLKQQHGYCMARVWEEGEPRPKSLGRVHRIVYQLLRGLIPEGMILHHVCRNTACCNPDHMKVMTQGEHLREDGHRLADQVARTHCPKGHPYSGGNLRIERLRDGYKRSCRKCVTLKTQKRRQAMTGGDSRTITKLIEANVAEIRSRHAAGENCAQLGRAFKVTDETIRRAVRRLSWRHLP